MNKCLIILLLLLISTLKTFSQEEIFRENIEWEEGAFNAIMTNIFKDNKQELTCVLINDITVVKGFVFNNLLERKQDFEVQGLNEEDIIGGYISNNVVYIFAKKKKGNFIKNITFNLNSEESEINEIPIKLKEDKFVGQINTDHAFLYITASKKEPILTVYKFSNNKIDTLTYDLSKTKGNQSFSKSDLWTALTKQDGLSRTMDVAIVQPDLECGIDVANSPSKLYIDENNLLLVLDKNRGETMIFKLNLDNEEIEFRKVNRTLEQVTQTIDIPTFNSFILENNLYYIDASLQKLTLIINDLDTGKEIKRFETLASENISFKNTPIIQEGYLFSAYSLNKSRELEKTIQLLRKMVRGRSVITVSKNEGRDELTIGAYKEVKQGSGGMMMGSGGMGFNSAPMYVPYGINTWDKLIRFKSLFDPKTNEHILSDLSLSPYEQLQEFVEENDISKQNMNIFSIKERYYLTYFSEKEAGLVIIKFEREN